MSLPSTAMLSGPKVHYFLYPLGKVHYFLHP
jgi:hypothetical protein